MRLSKGTSVKLFLLILLTLISGVMVVSCNKETSSQEVIKVGEVGSMTGSEATFGTSTHNAVVMAFDRVNKSGGIRGKKLELISLDDQSKTSEAVLAIEKLISQYHVQAVIGEVASSISIAMAPIAQKHSVPMISPSSLNTRVTKQGDFIFRVCFVDEFQSKVMADFASRKLMAKKVALLVDFKSDYSTDSARIFKQHLLKSGGEIVIEQTYSAGDIDFKAQLTAIRSKSPDLIVVPGYYTEIGLIYRQKQELGISAPMLGGDAWDSPKLTEIAGASIEGSYFVTHFFGEDPQQHVQDFIREYKERFGEKPDGIAAMGYDAAMVLIDSLTRSDGKTPQSLRNSIAKTTQFKGVTGSITLNSERNAETPAVILKVIGNGRFSLVIQMSPVREEPKQ